MDYILLKSKLYKLLRMPPNKAIKKINRKINTKLHDIINQKRDLKNIIHINYNIKVLYSFIDSKQLNTSKVDQTAVAYLLDIYLNHYFNLLGSGFIKVDYNIDSPGVEGIKYDMSPKITDFDNEGDWLSNILLPTHMGFSKGIWQKVDKTYAPIDWSMDFKSGFRYSAKTWYKKQPIGVHKGADIKVPWEISRMQHLPQMAVFSLMFPEKRNSVIKEFKNQVLDFCMTNPIRMGANWACTMDVGIRAANMLIAYDILKGIDENNILDNDFEHFFGSFIYEHGDFIIHNLEWGDGENGNHYLSDICGLLFISAYLDRNETTDAWLVFSIQEIICCMERQFYDDGGNFEASTSYHRLSSELMIYSTALIYGLLKGDKKEALKEYNYKKVKRLKPLHKQKFNIDDEMFFPDWYLDRLYRAGLFTMDITKENGRVPQIGDNDSGRFFRLSPVGKLIDNYDAVKRYSNLKGWKERKGFRKYFDEDVLNNKALVGLLNGIFDFDGFFDFSKDYLLEKSIIESLSKGFKIKKTYEKCRIEANNECPHSDLEYKKTTKIEFKEYIEEDIDISNLRLVSYPLFGIYIFKADNFYLSIFAGNSGQNGLGGHSHSDKLSFELNLAGKDIFVDPGTYLYTPLPNRRNEFRSIKAHNVLIVDSKEQSEFLNLFSMKDETKCRILDFGEDFIRFKLKYRDVVIVREFRVYCDRLIINDSCNKEFKVNLNRGEVYSSGYGKLEIKR